MSQKRKTPPTTTTSSAPPKKTQQDYPSVNELKKRIRNAKRLLNRDDLRADARIVQERVLGESEKELQNETRRRQRSEMIGRYHFVRFLDRKSATKELKPLLRREKELSSNNETSKKQGDNDNEEERASLSRKIHIARVNLNYTIYYPLMERYVSLYAEKQQRKKQKKNKDEDNTEDEEKKRDADDGASDHDTNANANGNTAEQEETEESKKPEMWYVIERYMNEDGAESKLEALREGISESESAQRDSGFDKSGSVAAAAAKDKGKRKAETKKAGKKKEDVDMRDAESAGDEDDSDGGFFEE